MSVYSHEGQAEVTPNPIDQEADLVEQSRHGDRKAFETIVETYKGRIFSLVYRMVQNRTTAEDLTQDTFMRIYTNLHRFDNSRRLWPWIVRIATNLTINHCKHSARREIPSNFEERTLSYEGPDPEARALQKENMESVEWALSKMEWKYRIPLLLKHMESLSYSQMAQILDESEANLKMRVSRARRKLKQLVQERNQS